MVHAGGRDRHPTPISKGVATKNNSACAFGARNFYNINFSSQITLLNEIYRPTFLLKFSEPKF